ncbi:Glutaredoxin domain protein [Aspergillus clavatus NRRL 1]|uniref:Glutaredoxin domain protein n=1 Tax=Aspergillus clavatus (strain ATCC 1007 / CBS 513.65 / DSM 816 / NCTC 3887 / NRRL 1 / QM 1276 / 107) TaxID=344612 RepID=A1CQK0_ASPCL|nr:Glutaredoxin domain protein [Aspergillus clavatus NRRL 1]EAW07921.1 Glutaredoxin domain protein [Aspergillus clavatus NRRL 1]
MFAPRRIRLLVIAAILFLVAVFYYSGEAGTIQNQRFYRSTVAAIEAHREAKAAGTKNHVQPQNPTPAKPVEAEIKPLPKEDEQVKAAIPKEEGQETEEIPIAGRTKMTVPKKQDQDAPKKEPAKAPADDDSEAKNELNAILKRSPSMLLCSMVYLPPMFSTFEALTYALITRTVVIFSKSYCPYSKRAKSILLEKYTIVPAPHVVELDHHALGRQLQSLLGKNTGRTTVPNVLVNGKSIGGGDDVTALDEKDELASTLKNLGGKWIQEVNHKNQDTPAS